MASERLAQALLSGYLRPIPAIWTSALITAGMRTAARYFTTVVATICG